MNPLDSAELASLFTPDGPKVEVISTPKKAPYRILKLHEPMDRGEKKPATHLLELAGRFYGCPSAASARLWAERAEFWVVN